MSTPAEAIWDSLRGSAQGDGVLEIPSMPTEVQWEDRAVRFALGPDGLPCLLVPIDATKPPPPIQISRNLSVTVFRAKVAGVAGVYLSVMCLERRLSSVFGNFCQSVLDRITSGDDSAMAVKLAVDSFRALFSSAAGRELSDSERLGLLGELWMLERYVAQAPSLIAAWTGPKGQRHDFRRGNVAIEIKTSSKRGNEQITISSIEQLSRPDNGKLYLWYLVFEPVMEGPLSISSLLGRILNAGVERSMLQDAISGLNLDLEFLIANEKHSFAFEGESAYRIEPGFPRLSLEDFGGQLPVGVTAISYEIDLCAASQWKLDAVDMQQVTKDFAID